jgi:alginate O-acetyltransferase complex protein AlgI
MLFNSIQFLFFFAPVYILYIFLKHRWQNRLLILASCLFYAAWSWKFLVLMFVSITTDYFCAKRIENSTDPKDRKLFLILSIGVNLAILGFFKYFNFFAGSFSGLLTFFHIPHNIVFLNIILPLGVSFYTFEAISYVVDVYRKTTLPAKTYSEYLLFITYFPHLVAGPIMRAKSFLPQITNPRVLSLSQFYQGCFLFSWGLFEKMFVADNLAKIVNPIFASQGPYEGSTVLLGLYAFTFQIFCDFDGYSNMARGLGKMMGFDITINFNLPYFADNPKEFWRRWHISLSTWLRDYIYIPLGGNRKGEGQARLAILATMVLGGLWHGASWTFVVWGLYQALLLIAHRQFNWPNNIVTRILFFHAVVIGWLFFRSQSFDQIVQMLQAMLFHFNIASLDSSAWLGLIGFLSPLLAIQIWQYKTDDLMIVFKQNWLLKNLIYAFLTYLVLGFGVMKAEEFIYFQF